MWSCVQVQGDSINRIVAKEARVSKTCTPTAQKMVNKVLLPFVDVSAELWLEKSSNSTSEGEIMTLLCPSRCFSVCAALR